MRVLYVDDEPDIREIAQIALSLDPEITVETAASGAEAIVKAIAWRPDVILLDVMMPVMDGPSVLEKLRARPDTQGIRVVFITARTQAHEIERFRAMGAAAVISKPFDPMLLASQIRAAE
ncbi:response regulator [Chelatococcus sambhunathii]|uniref:Response regulator n=1 Tax=Chelatococcus sambhunathii TaxID=363953 RepID=A0ABU1DE90_9HYPH|nr:response regulator [Chelatococcus sambhunathii]MDR4306431.1 response regulator [Chelatococcus sambhunathii]